MTWGLGGKKGEASIPRGGAGRKKIGKICIPQLDAICLENSVNRNLGPGVRNLFG